VKVGLIVPTAHDERRGGVPGFTEIRDTAQQADAAGFDSLWIYDHLLHRFPGRPAVGFWEAWTLLSAIAAVTERVEVGSWVLCAAFRNPALLAKMAVTLDEVSAGRFVLGLGAGWHEPEFAAFGFPFDHRADRFEESLEIIVPLLRTGRADFTGRYHRAVRCEIAPGGPRPGGPPLMIAAFGPRMLRLAARFAERWNTDWLGPPAHLAERRAALEQACAEVGRDPRSLAVTGGVTIGLAQFGPLPRWLTEPGQCISGSAEQIADGLARYAEAGVSEVMCACYPNNAAALAHLTEAVRLLGERRGPADQAVLAG
jgi:probable F420-dependent oxidoreductase